MNFQQAGMVSIGLGFLLLVSSLFWTSIVPDQVVWTEEKALEYQEVAAKLHDDSYNSSLTKEQIAKSQAEFDEADKRLNRARAVKNSTPFYLRMSGISVCLVGVGLVLIARSQEQ